MCSINNALFAILIAVLSLSSVSCISGGDEAAIGQFPYVASLQSFTILYMHTCNCAIISEKFALTAAQCLYDDRLEIMKPAEQYHVFVDALDSYRDGIRYSVKKFVVHERYNAKLLMNDIGLIQLTDSIKFTKRIAPIAPDREFLGEDVKSVVSGWGIDEHGSHNLKYLGLTTITNDKCRQILQLNPSFKYPIVDFVSLCAQSSSEGENTCGDNGAPLVSNNTLIGIRSWGPKDCYFDALPNVFTRVGQYVVWIEKNMSTA